MLDACGMESGSEKEAEMKSMQNSTIAGSAMQGTTGAKSLWLALLLTPLDTQHTSPPDTPSALLSHFVQNCIGNLSLSLHVCYCDHLWGTQCSFYANREHLCATQGC